MIEVELPKHRLITKALDFASRAHEGQTRKGDDTPSVDHPLRVSLILTAVSDKPEIIAAGLLHDTLEDTDTTYADLVNAFGPRVANIVQNVTERNKSLSWKERKMDIILRIPTMNHETQLVKAADKIDFLKTYLASLIKIGPSFMERFSASPHDILGINQSLHRALLISWRKNPLLPEIYIATQDLSELIYGQDRTIFVLPNIQPGTNKPLTLSSCGH